MKKYIITLLLVVTFLFSCFSACGKTGNTSSSEKETNSIQSEESKSESQKEIIKFANNSNSGDNVTVTVVSK